MNQADERCFITLLLCDISVIKNIMDKTFITYCEFLERCSLANAIQHSIAIVQFVRHLLHAAIVTKLTQLR